MYLVYCYCVVVVRSLVCVCTPTSEYPIQNISVEDAASLDVRLGSRHCPARRPASLAVVRTWLWGVQMPARWCSVLDRSAFRPHNNVGPQYQKKKKKKAKKEKQKKERHGDINHDAIISSTVKQEHISKGRWD